MRLELVRKVGLPVDLMVIHMEMTVEATRIVEFSEGENKEQWFLDTGINESNLWSLLKYRCPASTIGGFDLGGLG